MSENSSSAVAVIVPESSKQLRNRQRRKPKRQPRYHVILWNDDEHTYEYVIRMMGELFGHSSEKGYQIACQVDSQGRAVCLTTTLEHAELKRDQIHAFGKDRLLQQSTGSMKASLESEGT